MICLFILEVFRIFSTSLWKWNMMLFLGIILKIKKKVKVQFMVNILGISFEILEYIPLSSGAVLVFSYNCISVFFIFFFCNFY